MGRSGYKPPPLHIPGLLFHLEAVVLGTMVPEKGSVRAPGQTSVGSVGFRGVELGFPSNEVLLLLEHVAEQPLPEVKAGKFLSTAPHPCPSVTPRSEAAAPALKMHVFSGLTPKLVLLPGAISVLITPACSGGSLLGAKACGRRCSFPSTLVIILRGGSLGAVERCRCSQQRGAELLHSGASLMVMHWKNRVLDGPCSCRATCAARWPWPCPSGSGGGSGCQRLCNSGREPHASTSAF